MQAFDFNSLENEFKLNVKKFKCHLPVCGLPAKYALSDCYLSANDEPFKNILGEGRPGRTDSNDKGCKTNTRTCW